MQSLALIAILTMFLASAYVLIRANISLPRSISMHVADSRVTYIFFAVATTFAAILMVIYVLGWLVPTLHLPFLTTSIWIIGLLCQLGSAWTRHRNDDLESRIHYRLAYTMAACMPVVLGLTVVSPYVTQVPRLIVIGVISIMMVLVGLYATEHVKRNYLTCQLMYLACYALGVITLTYA